MIYPSGKFFISKIKTFNNTYVRAGVPFPNPRNHVTDLYKYLEAFYQKEMDKRKAQKDYETALLNIATNIDELNKVKINESTTL